jgi:hypothetical protein
VSALRDIAKDIARRPPPPLLAFERMFATERAAAQLESRRIGTAQREAPDPDAVDAIDAAGLRRLIGTLWPDRRWNRAAARVIARGREISTRSLDRAIILACLRHYPVDHPAFADLRAAAAAASMAHDWPWATRAERWVLWTDDGPRRVREAVAADAMDDPGLMRRLAGSAFLAAGPALA